MKPWQKEAFAETAYKRLFWQGYNGRFGALHWPTEYRIEVDLLIYPQNYMRSENKAWRFTAGLNELFYHLDLK